MVANASTAIPLPVDLSFVDATGSGPPSWRGSTCARCLLMQRFLLNLGIPAFTCLPGSAVVSALHHASRRAHTTCRYAAHHYYSALPFLACAAYACALRRRHISYCTLSPPNLL